jgi:hypothetical protein
MIRCTDCSVSIGPAWLNLPDTAAASDPKKMEDLGQADVIGLHKTIEISKQT